MSLRQTARAAALGALVLGLAAPPASALSCRRPDIVNAFSDANAADEVYVIVKGRFSGGPGPRPGGTTDGKPRSYRATFSGETIHRGGPTERLNTEVIVTETCAGPWCAELNTADEVLTFLQVNESGGSPALVLDPCYGSFFVNPTESQLQAIQDCFENGCTSS